MNALLHVSKTVFWSGIALVAAFAAAAKMKGKLPPSQLPVSTTNPNWMLFDP